MESDMAPKPLIQKRYETAIEAFLAANMGMVHREDVGPLFGQLALLCRDTRPDAVTRRYWSEAVSAALAPDTLAGNGGRVQWVHAVAAAGQRRSTPSRSTAVLRAHVKAGIRSAGRAPR
jgi:hypothetical protein